MKKILLPIFAFVLAISATFIVAGCNNDSPAPTNAITISQQPNEQIIHVGWDNTCVLDKVEISVMHGNEVVSLKTITTSAELLRGKTDIGAYYGKQNVKVTIYSKNKSKTTSETINVYADEYNIAPLSGSLPVLMFTLSALDDNGLMYNSEGKAIPTFVWLDRSGAYDWANLPQGMYPMPTASVEDYTTPNKNRSLMYSKTAAYIKELVQINSNSKINLFLNDFDTDQYFNLLVSTGLSSENYTCTFISDGAFSYSIINDTFNVENATEKYNTMLTSYNKTKEQVIENGYYDYNRYFEIAGKDLQQYLLVMANEDSNVTWWFPRLRSQHINIPKDTTNLTQNKILNNSGNLKEYGINTLLTNIQKNQEKVALLKALYKFNDDMFAKANEENKKVMMLLGSWATNETEANFVDYANFVKKYYGDEYVYYYKGHPNSPTNLYPVRAELLENMGLIDIESTIAAELILFYFPDIYMSGYSSSTFNSIQNKEMACAYWGSTKEQAINNASIQNGNLFDVYITPASVHGTTYNGILTEGHNNYIVEFSVTENYDVAVYDATLNTITYYKQENGNFTKVEI